VKSFAERPAGSAHHLGHPIDRSRGAEASSAPRLLFSFGFTPLSSAGAAVAGRALRPALRFGQTNSLLNSTL
jgi:hypothetical protein